MSQRPKNKNGGPLFAFFGTPEVATHALSALEARGLLPALVITAPDKPRGRGREVSPTPVKAWALKRGIDTLTPDNLKDEALLADLANTDWDFFLVAAYAKFLPQALLEMPARGALNIHPSLLPKYRGPSPVLSAILADDRQTGVSIMQMSGQMDAGPIVAQARVEIAEEDWPLTSSMLSELLFTEGGNLLAEVLEAWLKGHVAPEVQDENQATFTKKFADEDALIDVNGDPRAQLLKIKAFDAGPRAHFFTKDGKRVIITDAALKDGTLEILTVIPEGKKETPFATFAANGKQ